MATLITKNSSTASAVPLAGDLTKGELAVNVTDKKVYTKDNVGNVVKLVGSLGNQEANDVAITGGTAALASGTVDGKPIGFKNVPPVGSKTASYTLQSTDVGKYIQLGTGGSIIVPTGVFAEGDVVSFFNNTTGTITITCSALTAYRSGTATAVTSASLAARGVASVLFISSSVCVLTGAIT